ncbi:LPS export ABC transporter periplasmic protein LptC [Rhabdochromatium marinum]|uniref:LPS export ABC transporter periplasmic protein LptC n=1 Tax=Rhabdochromatium marinum TaxID=48729 RepID=UPI001908AD33|nr:LPS export ABC transporter periplasmic protein LptC [Rhabdochromatium marinum]MBK1647530.1 LPS export ABC transporter periplasmic protein LptC [Rhabdochromatium marinum]
MLEHRRQRLLAVTLALLGLLAWWFAQLRPAPELQPGAATDRQPDYVVDGIRALMLDDNGHPSRRLSAEQLRHYPDNDSSELEHPRLLVYDQQAPSWDISSERGWVAADAKQITLSGAVTAHRAATPDSAAIRLLTSEMTFFPDDKYAETDRFVEIDSGPHRITSVHGLHLWYLEPLHGRLFGRVRARIAMDHSTR